MPVHDHTVLGTCGCNASGGPGSVRGDTHPAPSMRSMILLVPPTVIDNVCAMSATRQRSARSMICIGSNHDNGRLLVVA